MIIKLALIAVKKIPASKKAEEEELSGTFAVNYTWV